MGSQKKFSPELKQNIPPNPNETPTEQATHIKAELPAAEWEANEELRRKWELLCQAHVEAAQRSLEEVVQRVHEEEEQWAWKKEVFSLSHPFRLDSTRTPVESSPLKMH